MDTEPGIPTNSATPSEAQVSEANSVPAEPVASATAINEPTALDAVTDEAEALKDLTENVRDQDDLEQDITYQASLALIEAENKKDVKRIEKAENTKSKLENQLKTQQQKLGASHANPTARLRIQKEIARLQAEIELCDKDIADFRARIEQRAKEGTASDSKAVSAGGRLPNETQREYLIRTGKITPFATFGGPRPDDVAGELAEAIIDAEEEAIAEELEEQREEGPRSHQNLRLPGFAEDNDDDDVFSSAVKTEFSLRPRKRRKTQQVEDEGSDEEFVPDESTSEAATSEDYESDDFELDEQTPKRKRGRIVKATEEEKIDLSNIDDGNESVYQRRLKDWVQRRSRARRRHRERLGHPADEGSDDEEEWFKPLPDTPDYQFEGGLKLPGDIYPALFDYQKTGVRWLAELYSQQVGGIIGDEMGLGKTGMLNTPVLLIA